MDEVKVKSCPFCGNEIIELSSWCNSEDPYGFTKTDEWGLRCVWCGAEMPGNPDIANLNYASSEDILDVVDSWNRRAPDARECVAVVKHS